MAKLFAVLVLLSGIAAHAQALAQNLPTPLGTFFTESFGDTAALPCGYGAPWNTGLYASSGCDAIWGNLTLGSGGSISIVPSPGSKAYPRGPNSLKVVTGTSNTFVASAGFTPQVSTAFDLQFTLYVASTTLPGYDNQALYSLLDSDRSSYPCRVDFHTTSTGSVSVRGVGSGDSSDIPISLNADHTVFLHCVPGGKSYAAVDGGAHQAFTANSASWIYQVIGDSAGTTSNMTYYIGNVLINANVQSAGNGPLLYTNFESGANGAQLTPSILAASTAGGNGGWSCSNGSYQTVSTAAQLGLLNPVTVLGTQFTDTASTRGAAFAYAGTTGGYCAYHWASYAPTASTFEWAQTTLPTNDVTSYVSMDILGNALGSDFVSHMQFSGKLYNEAQANPNGQPDIGSFFAYAPGVKYGIATQFQQYSAGSVPGGVYLVQGSVTGGTFVPAESITQASTGAAATLLIPPTGSKAMEIQAVSGTADSSHAWTGSASGAVFTPTSLPTTFHTVKIYDQNCNLLSTQLKLASANSPSAPNNFELGRGGDSNASGINSFWYSDNLFIDYATGNFVPCH